MPGSPWPIVVELVGDVETYATPFPVVECAASVLGSIGAAAAAAVGGAHGRSAAGHRGACACRCLAGRVPVAAAGGRGPAAGPTSRERPLVTLYRCRDGRWVHLQGSPPHLAARTCAVLGCAVDSSVDVVADGWPAGTPSRSRRRWPRPGRAAPWRARSRSGRATPRPRPSRRWAGSASSTSATARPSPVGSTDDRSRACGSSTSAGCSPDRSTAARWPSTGPRCCWSTRRAGQHPPVRHGHQPRQALLSGARRPGRCRAVRASWRPGPMSSPRATGAGSLARRGFSPEELAELRPGIIMVSINCYGDAGPWRQRPGWEQLAQTVTGMVIGQGSRPPRAARRRRL